MGNLGIFRRGHRQFQDRYLRGAFRVKGFVVVNLTGFLNIPQNNPE